MTITICPRCIDEKKPDFHELRQVKDRDGVCSCETHGVMDLKEVSKRIAELAKQGIPTQLAVAPAALQCALNNGST